MSTRSLNKVMLIGNLTRDPEVRYTANGVAVATFGLATNRSYKDASGELKELTEFHNIVAWNKMAEICQQILAKGMKVYIEGSLTTRSWEDEASGVTKYKTEIRVDEMILLQSNGKQGAGGAAMSASSTNDDSDDNASTDDSTSTDDMPAEEAPKKSGKKSAKAVAPKEEKAEELDPLADEDLPF